MPKKNLRGFCAVSINSVQNNHNMHRSNKLQHLRLNKPSLLQTAIQIISFQVKYGVT